MEAATGPPGVSTRMTANALAVKVAGRIAAGAAEALDLGFGPARRLTAITLEATQNAVEHAYLDRDLGAIELAIGLGPPGAAGAARNGDGREIRVSVRDFGGGCPLTPTSSEPPGLGLSIMSELSEMLMIRSRRDGGTEIDALVRSAASGHDGASPEHAAGAEPPRSASELVFGDPGFLAPVLPRAIAMHVAALDGSIDAVGDAIARGRAISRSLADDPHLPAIAIGEVGCAGPLRVGIGPLAPARAEALVADLGGGGGSEQVRLQPPEGKDRVGNPRVLVDIPIQ